MWNIKRCTLMTSPDFGVLINETDSLFYLFSLFPGCVSVSNLCYCIRNILHNELTSNANFYKYPCRSSTKNRYKLKFRISIKSSIKSDKNSNRTDEIKFLAKNLNVYVHCGTVFFCKS